MMRMTRKSEADNQTGLDCVRLFVYPFVCLFMCFFVCVLETQMMRMSRKSAADYQTGLDCVLSICLFVCLYVCLFVYMFVFWNLDDDQEISGGSSERIGLCFVQLSPESVATCSASSVLCSTLGKSGLGKYSPASTATGAPLKVSTV